MDLGNTSSQKIPESEISIIEPSRNQISFEDLKEEEKPAQMFAFMAKRDDAPVQPAFVA
jgi:hypothetical protein